MSNIRGLFTAATKGALSQLINVPGSMYHQINQRLNQSTNQRVNQRKYHLTNQSIPCAINENCELAVHE